MRTQAIGIAVVFGLLSATLAAVAQPGGGPAPAGAPDASAGASDSASAPDGEPAAARPPEAGAPSGEPDAGDAGADAPAEPVDAAPGAAAMPLADAEAPHEPSDVGFHLGLHGGYAIPFGSAKDSSFSDIVAGAVPLGVDVGYFINRHLYVGVFATYGFVTNSNGATSTCPNDPDISCSANLWRFGAAAHYHLIPSSKISPWVGGALGYEIINVTATDTATGADTLSGSLQGFDISALAGVDYKPRPYFGLGPYTEFTMGHFATSTGSSTKLFEWLSFGVRLRTGI